MIKRHKIYIILCIMFIALLPMFAKKPPFVGGSLAFSLVKGDAGEYFVNQGLMFTREMDGWSNTMPRTINRNTMEPYPQGLDHLGLKFEDGKVKDVIVFETKFRQKNSAETLNESVGQGTLKWINKRIREQAIDNIDFCSSKLRSGDCIIDSSRAFRDYQIDWKVYIDSDSYYYKPLGSSELHFYDGLGKYKSIDSITGQSIRTMNNLYDISNGMYEYRRYLIHYTIEDGHVIENKFRMRDSKSSNKVDLELKGRKDITNSKALDNVVSSNRYESYIKKRYNLIDESVLKQLDNGAKVDLLNGKFSSSTIKTLLSSSKNTEMFNEVLNLNIRGALSDIKFTDAEFDAIGRFMSTGNKDMLNVDGTLRIMNKLKNADINSRLGINLNTDFAAIGFSQSEILKLNGFNGSNFDDVITPAMAKKIYSTPENKQILKDSYAKQARRKKGVSSADIDADINSFSKKIDDMALSNSDYQYLAKTSSQHAENMMFVDYTKKAMYGTIKSSMLAAGGAFAVDTIYQGFRKGWTEIDWRESVSASLTFGAVMGANALGNYTGDLLQNGLLKSSNIALRKMGKYAPFGVGVAVDTLIDGAFLFSSAYKGDITYGQAAASLAVNVPFNGLSWLLASKAGAATSVAVGTALANTSFGVVAIKEGLTCGSLVGGVAGALVGGAVGVLISGASTFIIVPMQKHMEIKNLYGQIAGMDNISIILGWTDEYLQENNLF